MSEGILSTIGNTPLIRLTKVFKDLNFKLYAKLEAFNPGGSIKDRAGYRIIMNAMEEGQINPGTTVIESSSGNLGIALAQVCSYLGLKFVCVVDPKTTTQNIRILKAYNADVVCVEEPDPATGEYLQARLSRVLEFLESHPNSFWPDQYSNLQNAAAHHRTMHEIVTKLNGQVDYLFCAASTCGTLRGCVEYLWENHFETRVFAVDAVGSVIFGQERKKRLIPGHGAAIRPRLFRPDLTDECVHVTDLECVIGCRKLIRREAILAGGSSGGVLMAVDRMKHKFRDDSTCVVIFPDRGERYLDTIYSDGWITEHFGDVSSYWEDFEEEPACEMVTY